MEGSGKLLLLFFQKWITYKQLNLFPHLMKLVDQIFRPTRQKYKQSNLLIPIYIVSLHKGMFRKA